MSNNDRSKQEARLSANLKLSDGGAWRGSCEGGAQKEATDVELCHERTRRVQARIAATVTRGAVRSHDGLNSSLTRGHFLRRK